jgi:hypothetical protein
MTERKRATAKAYQNPGFLPEDIELVHRTDSVDDAYDWIVRQLAEKAPGRPGARM